MDALRGFALGGILLMNIEYFTRPLQGLLLGADASPQGADAVAAWCVTVFVQGKFWVLFSLLFGAGFAIMLERAQARGLAFASAYARRLGVLLLIGIAHAWLLWARDILVPYALGGAALLLCFRYTARSMLWKLGLLLYLLPLLFLWLFAGLAAVLEAFPALAGVFGDAMQSEVAQLQNTYDAAAATYQNGSWSDVVHQRMADTWMLWGSLPSILPNVIGVFLLGASLHNAGVLRDPTAHRALLRRLLMVGAPLGTGLAVFAIALIGGSNAFDMHPRAVLGQSVMLIANLLLAFVWLAALLLAMQRPGDRLRAWLAPAGRMALSNYLLQSLVFTSLFYGYGLGAWGQVPRLGQIGLALAFFLLQLLGSRWWMRHVRIGPVEWLWRALTWWRLPAWRA